MAGSVAVTKIACMVVVCMVVAVPFAEAAITCSSVAKTLTPCIPYLTKGGPVSGPCCSGVKSLVALAKTTTDRRTACGCLKTAAKSINVNPSYAAALPKKCGVNLPYPISSGVDCSKVPL